MATRRQIWGGMMGMGALLVGLGWHAPLAHAAAPAEPTPATLDGAEPAATMPPVNGTAPKQVLLVPGDTLWGLAQTYHTTVALLQQANGLGDSTLIYAGNWLTVPGQVTVLPGNTLWQIAAAYGVSVDAIMALNGLTDTTIVPGQVLAIPAPEPPAAPATTLAAQLTQANVLVELAHLVQAEAGNQPFLGMVGVAAVVLNRVKAPGFPKTVSGVIFQPGQFESVANGTYWLPPSAEAYQAAQEALNGVDPTDGALYFYNPALTNNPWMKALPVTVTIGQQVFCR
jgi:N-acetylmuramoyl-L-alanine amidase